MTVAVRIAAALLAALIGVLRPPATTAASPPPPLGADEAAAIAIEAYAYAYPLVLTELTRRVQTNVGDGAPATAKGAAVNAFAHQRTLVDASTTEPLRPNADVLVSTLWYDVSAEPLVITIPDAGGRYYALPMFDAWMEVFATPGPRTTGGGAQTYALTAPGWSGMLPANVGRITAPTPTGWIAARIATHGSADYEAVHRFQDGLAAVPLGRFGTSAPAPHPTYDARRDMQLPAAQILRLPIAQYFGLFATLAAANPPHPTDWSVLQRAARIGAVPGRPFALERLPPDVQAVVQQTPRTAGQALFDAWKRSGTRVNGWRSMLTPMGTYGSDYRRRQVVAYSAFGAESSDDTYVLTAIVDTEGRPLEGGHPYTLHFDAITLPPVHAFWSVTAYDERQLLAPGTRPRVTIGSRDPLTKNSDGSLDLHLQSQPPPPEQAANWLPTPAAGRFSLTLRLYWPETPALDGTWLPPGVTRVGAEAADAPT